jgi:hypothetical protein
VSCDAEFIAAFRELRAAYAELIADPHSWRVDDEAVKSIRHPKRAASRVYEQAREWSHRHGSAGDAVPLPPRGSGPQVVELFVSNLRAVLDAYGPLVDEAGAQRQLRHDAVARLRHPQRPAHRVAERVAKWNADYPDPETLLPGRLTSGDLPPHDDLYDAGPG